LTPDTFSALHRLASDEVFHFYLGDPVEMLQVWPDGSHRVVLIGTDLAAGERPQVVVPRGIWQGARLRPGGRFALLGTTVAPGSTTPTTKPPPAPPSSPPIPPLTP
jgi:predicted cupin superfamily sugar epimerase